MDIYHCVNHAIPKHYLFLDGRDHARGVHNLYEFNDARPINNLSYRFNNKGLRNPYFLEDTREKIVDILGWCFMKDHYHLLLSERVEGGIGLFLRKFNVGYANYYNERYKRAGTLFRGRTKKILIERDAHFNYILHYIHLNPLDYLSGAEKWRVRSTGGIRSAARALTYLDSYRWSSYLDYCGKKNFPSVLNLSLLGDVDGTYQRSLASYLKDAENASALALRLE
jgi:putative transposase